MASALLACLPFAAQGGAIKHNVTPGDMTWPNGRIPYVFKDDVTEEQRQVFRLACRAWQRFANLRFVPTTQSGFHSSPDGAFVEVQKNDIDIGPLVRDVNYAWIGRCGYLGYPWTGMQPMSIHNWKGETVLHELGHVIGFIHEQCRHDRDDYLELFPNNRIPLTDVNFNIERSWAYTPYDFESQMHYHSKAFALPWLGDEYLTMRAKAPNEDSTGWMGGSYPRFPDEKGTPVGRITQYLSAGDRHTVKEVYGASNTVKGKVRLSNGHVFKNVQVELIGNGTDETHFTNLLAATNERVVKTNNEGEYVFYGVPDGQYRVKATMAGFTFTLADIPINTAVVNPFEQDFIVTNAGDNTAPHISITFPSSTATPHFQGVGTQVHRISHVGGTVTDPGGLGVQEVEVAMSRGNQWFNWDTGLLDPPGQAFNEGPNGRNLTDPGGAPLTSWVLDTAKGWPVYLSDGAYKVQVRARDLSNNWSAWNEEQYVFTIDSVAPVVSLDSLGTGNVIFDFEASPIGGTFIDLGDPDPDVFWFVEAFDATGFNPAWWNGSRWVPGANPTTECRLPVTIEGGRWTPAEPRQIPSRAALREHARHRVHIYCADKAGQGNQVTSPDLSNVIQDESVPEITFAPSRQNAVYTERAMPPITGTSSDEQSYIKGIELYLMRLVPKAGGGMDYKYWTGDVWSDTQCPLAVDVTPVPGNPAHVTWSAPGNDYTLPSGADLPDGTYKMQVATHNRESPQLGTQLIEETFHIALSPPQVAVTSVTHNGWAKAGWTIGGTVADPAAVGFGNGGKVSLTIYRDGFFWNGSAWRENATAVEALIQEDNTWAYPGTTGDLMPTGDGQYSIAAHVTDNNGNSNAIVPGGQPGNNQVLFRVDATPPELALTSPAPGTVVAASPLSADWVRGTATDASGPVTVTFRLKQIPAAYYYSTLFWNQESWQTENAFYGGEINLPGTFGAGADWQFTGHLPKPGWEYGHCLTNGSYEVVAVASDPAGNETTLTRGFTVDYHPPYLPAGVEGITLRPAQTAPVAAATVSASETEVGRYNGRAGAEDQRNVFARHLAVAPDGTFFTGSDLSPDYQIAATMNATVQRLGAAPWRSERTRSVTSTQDGPQYYESWFGGPASAVPYWRYEPLVSSIKALETDAAGNVYALYDQRINNGNNSGYTFSRHLLLVKYNAGGSVAWVRSVPEVEYDYAYLGTPGLKGMSFLPDGSLGLLLSFGSSSYVATSTETAMLVFETNGSLRYARTLGITDYRVADDPAAFNSQPVGFAGDAAGNVFVASIESDRGNTPGLAQPPMTRRVIRKLSPAGMTIGIYEIDTCDFPERWDMLAADAAGNLYLGGSFIGGIRGENDPERQEVLKFDNNLQLLWRAYGPPRATLYGNNITRMDAAADGVMTIDNTGVASFYTSAGVQKWSREIMPGASLTEQFTFAGGSAVGVVYVNSPGAYHLVKVSRAGDLQFDMSFGSNYDSFADIHATAGHIYLLRQASYSAEAYVVRFDNPADVFIPVTLDPGSPADQVLMAGDPLELRVTNSGTLATAYQWRKITGGTPADIFGANAATYTVNNVAVGDVGQYECVVTNPAGSVTSRRATVALLQPVTVEAALDLPGRTWTTGGDAPFVGFAAAPPHGPAHDGVDAVMNRSLQPSQAAYIETTVTGPGEVNFWWKASTDYWVDDFVFSIDGEAQNYISGNQDWTPVSMTYGPGTHTLRWRYFRASNSATTSTTQHRVWLDAVSFATTVALDEALDAPELAFTTSEGDLAWKGTSSPAHDGVDSAVSGTTGNYQQSSLETTVTGPGTLTFWWKVSCENYWDFLQLYLDDTYSASITGEADWAKITRTIPAGTHTVKWIYKKDSFGSGGLDKAWVDQVVFTPDSSGPPEIVVEQPAANALADGSTTVDFATVLPGSSAPVSFTIRNTGSGPLTGLSLTKDGTHAADFSIAQPGVTTLPVGQSTTFTVTFAPPAGSGGGPRHAAIHLASNDADENPFDIQLTGTVGVPITDWRQQHFGSNANSGDAADDADPDHDGVPNLLEFATGASPAAGNTAPSTPVEKPAGNLATFTYTRSRAAMAGLLFQVQWTDTLTGPWSSQDVVETIISDNGVMQQVRATFPAGASGRRFVRLQVTRP